jgi:hypothetical protein
MLVAAFESYRRNGSVDRWKVSVAGPVNFGANFTSS